jgi:hypothetical protein
MAKLNGKSREVRGRRAEHKRGAPAHSAPRLDVVRWVAEALDDPVFDTMPIGELIEAIPRWGPDRAQRLLGPLMIRWSRNIGDLTERQRERLLQRLAEM